MYVGQVLVVADDLVDLQFFFFFNQKTAYEVRISDWSSDVCSSDLFAAVVVDLSGCSDKEEALARLQMALKFPDWFGGNWDALADCLSDMSWWPAAGYLLLLEHAGGWREAQPEEFDTTLSIIQDAASSAGRRLGQGGGSTCRSRWGPVH